MNNGVNDVRYLPKDLCEELLKTLKTRFDKNTIRHEGVKWGDVQSKLEKNIEKLWSLNQMETTGGEPDVIGYDLEKNGFIFCDCSKESPAGRRNVCYDHAAQESRKKFKPLNNAIDLADSMGVEILAVDQYQQLQRLGQFDTKTSSWVKTPDNIRKLGGALFCDCRYDTVFVYHNGAESYYSVRGFRSLIIV